MRAFKPDDLPPALRAQLYAKTNAVASRVRNPEPEQTDRKKQVCNATTPQEGSGRTIVIITRCSTGRLDRDNLWGGAKATCDALRYSGQISGDTEEDIELFVFQKKVKRADTGTLIEIFKLPGTGFPFEKIVD